MAKSDFTNRILKQIGQKNWKHFKEADDVFGAVDLPDGVYECRLQAARYGFTKDDKPYVAFQFIVTDGPNKGQKPRKFHGLHEQGKRTLDDALKYLSIDFQRLGIQPEDVDIHLLEDVCNGLSEDKPMVKILFQNSENPNWAPDVAIKGVIDAPAWEKDAKEDAKPKRQRKQKAKAEEPEEEEEPDEEAEEDEVEETPAPVKKKRGRPKKKAAKPDPEPEPEEEEEEEDAEEDEDMITIPDIGDIAECAPTGRGPKMKVVVIEVDQENETCNVRRTKDKKVFEDVPFARLDIDEIPF